MTTTSAYTGRFAPSPTGALHAGSLATALASWLDARAHAGRWLLRIEDVDTPRCVRGASEAVVAQLAALGLHADDMPLRQSTRDAAYRAALEQLHMAGRVYPCGCTRKEIEAGLAAAGGAARNRHHALAYPGTCRTGLHGRAARAWRLLSTAPDGCDIHIDWQDRRLGAQQQNVTRQVGDFVLKRADGLWAYQLAVVVDDAAQGVTHVVRGADLADNTARQIVLQHALGVPTPAYLHTPLVLAADGEKLSKQNGAQPVDTSQPLSALRAAGAVLGLSVAADSTPAWLQAATLRWRQMHAPMQA